MSITVGHTTFDRVDYDADRVTVRLPRACLRHPKWVKVNINTASVEQLTTLPVDAM